jgi:16S rRNA (cytidine1402-2'-O)-methyltransferase
MLGRELTKLHQEFLRGTASQLAEMLATRPKGEFTVVISQIGQQSKQVEARFASDEDIAAEFGHITDLEPISRREAVRATAQRLGIPSRQVYAAIERTKR